MTGRIQAFTTDEFRQRLNKVQETMQRQRIDLLILHSPENIYYLSGYQTSGYFAYQALIVTPSGAPTLLVRYLERGNIDEYSWLEGGETWREGEDVVQRTIEVVRQLGGTSAVIGIEKQSWFLTVDVAEQLAQGLTEARFVDGSMIVDRIRLIKSPKELDYIRQAGRVAETEIRAAIETMRGGGTEAEVAAAVFKAGVLAGCEYTGLPHHIMSGHRYNVCHANWTSKPIVAGELVLVELYGCVERYHATQMRTISIGEPAPGVKHASELVTIAQNAALMAMRPGVSSKAIDALVRGPIRAIRPDYYNRSGYSAGIGFPPRTGEWQALDFNETHDWEIQEGMVFHMLALACGFGISETVIVTKNGAERATPQNPRELIVV